MLQTKFSRRGEDVGQLGVGLKEVELDWAVRAVRSAPGFLAVALAFMLCQAANSQPANGYRDVASAREPGVRVEVSSFQFRSKKAEEQVPCPVNQGADASDALGPCHWQSNELQHLPQWVWVHFAGPRRIDKVVLHAASMASSPVEFSGQLLSAGGAGFHTLFHVQQAAFDPKTLSYTVHFSPVVTDNFRLLIEGTAASSTPQSWMAELAQLEVYGNNAASDAAASEAAGTASPLDTLHAHLTQTNFAPKIEDLGPSLAISTPWYRLVLDKSYPRILSLSLDSLGKGELGVNLLQDSGAYPVLDPIFQQSTPLGTSALSHTGNVFDYAPVEIAPGVYEQVSIRAGAQGFDLGLTAAANHIVRMRGGLFRFQFAANQTPTTFVCHPSKLINYVDVPTYLAAPDFGTAFITRDGRRGCFLSQTFFAFSGHILSSRHHAAPAQQRRWPERDWARSPGTPRLHFAVQALEPLPALLSRDPRLERFPKYSLDMVQWRPDTGMISNSVMSINCGLAMLFYAEQAVFAPHLADGISPMALVGNTVDRYFQGARGYMMPNANVYSPDWKSSRETPAYLVISGWYVIRTIGGMPQLHQWLKPMEAVADHIERICR